MENKILQLNYRTKKSRKDEILYIIDKTSPKYRSVNQFLDMAVDGLLREEVAGITRKEVYQYDRTKKDTKSDLGITKKSNSADNSQAEPKTAPK